MLRFMGWLIMAVICCWLCCSWFCCWHINIICCCSPTTEPWLEVGSWGKFMFQLVVPGAGIMRLDLLTFGAVIGSWSWRYQHIAPLLALRLQLPSRKYLQIMLLGCSRFLWCISSFLSLKSFWQVLHVSLLDVCMMGPSEGTCSGCTYQHLGLEQSGYWLHFFFDGWSLSLLWFIIVFLSLNSSLQSWHLIFGVLDIVVFFGLQLKCSQSPSHCAFKMHSVSRLL